MEGAFPFPFSLLGGLAAGPSFSGTVTTSTGGTFNVSSREQLSAIMLEAIRGEQMRQLGILPESAPAPVEEVVESPLEELLERNVTPRDPPLDPDFEELLERNVTRETDEAFEFARLLRGPIGTVIGRALGPIGAAIDILTPSELGSGELPPEQFIEEQLERATQPIPAPEIRQPPPPPLPPPPPTPLPVPSPEAFPLPPPTSPASELPSPTSSGTTPSTSAPTPSAPPSSVPSTPPLSRPAGSLSTSPFPFALPFPLPTRKRIRDTLKDRLRQLLRDRLLIRTALPVPTVAESQTPVPAPAVRSAPQPVAKRDTAPEPPGLLETLTGLGVGRLRLPRTSPSSAPGMSESCTQCEVDKCVQRAMDKQRKSRSRKKKGRKRKQQKLCVTAPKTLSQLVKLIGR